MSAINSPKPSNESLSGIEESLARRILDGLRRRLRRIGVEIAGRTGRYDRWKQVDWEKVERLVFVCSGNICRSPFAEALARRSQFKAISCGTTASGGAPADPTAIEVALRFEIDLRQHRSIRLRDLDLLASDLVVIMDVNHLRSARAVAEYAGAQVTMLGLWDVNLNAEIPDPFGKAINEFEQCFERIYRCMEKMQKSLTSSSQL